MTSMNPAEHSFAVHLDSLLGFAQELETQVHGVTKPSGQLEGLLHAPMLLGAFNEASSLDSSHVSSVAAMHAVLSDIREALTFATEVTNTVAQGYSKLDADLGAYLLSNGVVSDDHGSPAGVADSSAAGAGDTSSTAPAPGSGTTTEVTIANTTVTTHPDGSVTVTNGPSDPGTAPTGTTPTGS